MAEAPKPSGTAKRKEPEAEAGPPRRMREYLLAESAAAAKQPRSIPPVVAHNHNIDEGRELAEWMAATAGQQWALIHESEAKLGITPPPHLLDDGDDPDREKESKRCLGRDGLVRYHV